MAETNPYKILGLSDNASKDEATKAYRKLAKKYHPDLNPGDDNAAKKMAEVNAAYDAIMNDEPYGPKARQNPYTGYPPQNPYGGAGYVDPFEEMFRQAQRQSQQQSAQGQGQPTYRRTTVSPANGCLRVIIIILAVNLLFTLFLGRGCFSPFATRQAQQQTNPYSQSQPYDNNNQNGNGSGSSKGQNDSDSSNGSNDSTDTDSSSSSRGQGQSEGNSSSSPSANPSSKRTNTVSVVFSNFANNFISLDTSNIFVDNKFIEDHNFSYRFSFSGNS
ncbi:MAG: DnaJ domain-containing protein [Coriobacteriales bacterium]|nr:DnaJ domain-containing protein [Coriobacteriales bacterium]